MSEPKHATSISQDHTRDNAHLSLASERYYVHACAMTGNEPSLLTFAPFTGTVEETMLHWVERCAWAWGDYPILRTHTMQLTLSIRRYRDDGVIATGWYTTPAVNGRATVAIQPVGTTRPHYFVYNTSVPGGYTYIREAYGRMLANGLMEGTLVLTSNGYKPVEHLQAGEEAVTESGLVNIAAVTRSQRVLAQLP